MASKRQIKKNLAQALDIPAEVALANSRLIITGNSRLTAENHQGIVEYLPGKIVFKTTSGQAEVLGEQLTLAALAADELVIEGEILAVSLVEDCER